MSARRRLASLAAAVLTFAVCELAQAQTPNEFFRAKTISLLIGFGVGGEDDFWARTIARHLGSHIPGNPNILPQNAPGSGDSSSRTVSITQRRKTVPSSD